MECVYFIFTPKTPHILGFGVAIYVTGNYDANKLYNGVMLTNGYPMTELFTCEKLVYNLMDRNSIGYSQGCFM